MSSVTALQRLVVRARALIDAEVAGSRRIDDALAALLETLAGGFPDVSGWASGRVRNALRQIRRRLEGGQFRLPMALYLYVQCGFSIRQAVLEARAKENELSFTVAFLAEHSSVDFDLLAFYRRATEEACPWLAEADLLVSDMEVHLSRRAFEELILGGAESFAVSPGGRKRFSEIYGVLFGSTRIARGKTLRGGQKQVEHVHVEHCQIQLRAKGDSRSVEPSEQSLVLHFALRDLFFPQEALLGSFHTHPYSTARAVRGSAFGADLTNADRDSFREWQRKILAGTGDLLRLELLLAIGKDRKHARAPRVERLKPHQIRFQIGRDVFVLAVFRAGPGGILLDRGIHLKVPSLGEL